MGTAMIETILRLVNKLSEEILCHLMQGSRKNPHAGVDAWRHCHIYGNTPSLSLKVRIMG